MTYDDLIKKALKGRTVNKAATDWGIPQSTLDRFSKGNRLPDFQTVVLLAKEADVSIEEVVRICAQEEARKKPRRIFLEMGLATAMSVLVATFIGLATLLPSKEALAQGFEKVPFRQVTQWLKLLVSKIRKLAVPC